MNDDLVKAARVFLTELQRQHEAFAGSERGKQLEGIHDGVCETLLWYFESMISDFDEVERLLQDLEA